MFCGSQADSLHAKLSMFQSASSVHPPRLIESYFLDGRSVITVCHYYLAMPTTIAN